ncbi:MAG: nucleotidyltransferase family protein [Acidobacteriota bacterium]
MSRRVQQDPCFEPCLELLRLPLEQPVAASAIDQLLRQDPDHLVGFLTRHRIDQLVYRLMLERLAPSDWPEALRESLQWAQRRTAVAVLYQIEAAKQAAEALDGAEIPYVFFKGFHLGEALYGDAVLRPASDVDLLVAEGDLQRAIEALGPSGFARVEQAGQPSYEAALDGHGSQLDVHAHLFHPRRCRQSLTHWILAHRQERNGLWFPNEAAALLIMLLNPALTDHVTLQLIHAVDLDRWLRHLQSAAPTVDPQATVAVLEDSGVATAAWTMLDWTRSLLSTPLPPGFEAAVAPGPLRRAYLRQWLRRDPARLYAYWPLLVRGGFSLVMQDRLGDALRAVFGAEAG